MAENKDGFETILTNLALITDGMQAVFPSAKAVLVFELNYRDFNSVRRNFKNIKVDESQIKIIISGIEVIFILENSFPEEPTVEKVEEKDSFLKKFKNLFSNNRS
jgi:hypothetical protein